MTHITWPGGFSDFYYKVRLHAGQIVLGTLVAVDPASGGSSMPGYAVFKAGLLVKSGTIQLSKKLPIEKRLPLLYDEIQKLTDGVPDVFAIELIRGRFAHVHLQWSVGTSVAAARAPITLEIPIRVWKAVAQVTEGYNKTDQQDAEAMGRAVILLAQEAIRDSGSLPSGPKS